MPSCRPTVRYSTWKGARLGADRARAARRWSVLLAVVGMQAGQEHVVVDRRVRRQAEQGAAAVVPQQRAGARGRSRRCRDGRQRRPAAGARRFLARRLVAHALDVRPRAFGDLADHRQLVVGPGVRLLVVHRHQRRQPAFLDQRHADRGGDADRLEGGGFLRRELAAVVARRSAAGRRRARSPPSRRNRPGCSGRRCWASPARTSRRGW